MVTRRTVLLGSAGLVGALGALAVGWTALPPKPRLITTQPLPVGPGQSALNGWVKIGADNSVGIVMCKAEMGQGIYTGLAMVLAEELDADWAQVRVERAPIDKIYQNIAATIDGLPFHPDDDGTLKAVASRVAGKAMREIGVMLTGGSSSMRDLWLPMRQAGASARAMLVAAAAQQWKLPAAECRVEAGRVLHPSGKSVSFGELAAAAASQPLPDHVLLKDPKTFKLIGQPRRRLEAASKMDGSARFGIDVLQPGMQYASVEMCPTLGGRVASFDAAEAQKLPGVKKVLAVPGHNGGTGGVAVIADTPYHAMRAVKAVRVEWDHGPSASASTEEVYARLAQALDTDDGFNFYKHGDVDAALKSAAKTVKAEYRAPYLAHATMEPMNCTAQFKDGRATVWAATQVPDLARSAAAKVLGLAPELVDVQVQLLGGGFGRRCEVDVIAQAAAIARDAGGVPVQTIWSREQDMTHDFYRPACVSRFQAGLDASGNLLGWLNASAGQAIVPQVMKRVFDLPGAGPDKTTSEGAFDQPYEWPAARIGHEAVELPVPVGFWRSVGHSHNAFFKESFLDEVATAAGRDPVALRAALLTKHPRHLKVLQRAAELSGWDRPLPASADGAKRARGVALHQSFGSIVAQVAEVSVSADKRIRVHRVVCVIDCGIAVNPNLIRQQMESAIVYGLSAALNDEVQIEKGQVQQTNFHNHPVLRLDECPVIETDIIASDESPEGVGEPGTPPIAPAVANALFALTGQRLRSLPLKLA
ncbi:xanthine dehydrogenase family protein molybdopterin-binding subunit [Variovorax paradoxus]|nr:xanthine dehydrogenase family protein molybdopterin-binding subunit [Variovorax paradoxus]MBT2302051.1 xanthine dehydrogenase family protein molybdopterin-binding subunit [Variovorax paradoxus]